MMVDEGVNCFNNNEFLRHEQKWHYRITNGVKPGTAMLYIVFNNLGGIGQPMGVR